MITFYSVTVLESNLKTMGIILLFVFIGAASRLPQRLAPFSFGIELVSLVTIAGAIMFSGVIGALIGVAAMIASGFYTRERPQDVFIAIHAFAALGLLTPLAYAYFGSLGLTALALTIGYDLVTNFIYLFTGHNWMSCLRFSALHIPSNYLILTYLGPILIGLV